EDDCHHNDQEERAWAHGSLAELWLLRLAEHKLSDEQKSRFIANAHRHAEELSGFYPGVDEFPVTSTRRQFERYVDWWGTDRFESDLVGREIRRGGWWTGKGGIIE